MSTATSSGKRHTLRTLIAPSELKNLIIIGLIKIVMYDTTALNVMRMLFELGGWKMYLKNI